MIIQTTRGAVQTKDVLLNTVRVTVYFRVAEPDRWGAAMKKPQGKRRMTCPTSVTRLTAALHNPQGHSHHKPYVSEAGQSLSLWAGVSHIYWWGTTMLAPHPLTGHCPLNKNGRGLVGQTDEWWAPVRIPPQWHSAGPDWGQDLMVLSFMSGSINMVRQH